jgi:hypothetical protein
MYKYKIKIKKVSGRLNESVIPSKSLVVKSKTKKSNKQVFAEAEEYLMNKYGLQLVTAKIVCESFDENDYTEEELEWTEKDERNWNLLKIKQFNEIVRFIKGLRKPMVASRNKKTGKTKDWQECEIAASYVQRDLNHGTFDIRTADEKITIAYDDCQVLVVNLKKTADWGSVVRIVDTKYEVEYTIAEKNGDSFNWEYNINTFSPIANNMINSDWPKDVNGRNLSRTELANWKKRFRDIFQKK